MMAENANKANYDIHFPHDFEDFKKARRRLVFEELLTTQLALLQLKNSNLKSYAVDSPTATERLIVIQVKNKLLLDNIFR